MRDAIRWYFPGVGMLSKEGMRVADPKSGASRPRRAAAAADDFGLQPARPRRGFAGSGTPSPAGQTMPTRARRSADGTEVPDQPPARTSRRALPPIAPIGTIQPAGKPMRSVFVAPPKAEQRNLQTTDSAPLPKVAIPVPAEAPQTVVAPAPVRAAEPVVESSPTAPIAVKADPLTATRPTAKAVESVPKVQPAFVPPVRTLQPNTVIGEQTKPEATPSRPLAAKASSTEPRRSATPRPAAARKPTAKASTPLLDRRGRIALVAGTVAATLVVVIAIGLAVINGQNAPVAGNLPANSKGSEPFPSPRVMLSGEDAKLIDPTTDWREAKTQDTLDDKSPLPVCLTNRADGETPPTATLLRTLTTPATSGATALHILNHYPAPEDAAKAFDARLKQLGSCSLDPTYIAQGYSITGLGNQAAAITAVIQKDPEVYHIVVVVRTGSALSLYDVAQPKKAPMLANVLKAVSAATNDQCTGAVGLCSLNPKATNSPPPMGSGDPGFLAAGDIPRITHGEGAWSPAGAPKADYAFKGTLCEGVSSWRSAKNASDSRGLAYLLSDDSKAPPLFGFDQMLVTFKSDADATAFAALVKDSMGKCAQKSLTAKVSAPKASAGSGARGMKVSVLTYEVTQKTSDGELKYKTALVTAGKRVAYLMQPVDKGFTFTDDAWTKIAVRAGERATQLT